MSLKTESTQETLKQILNLQMKISLYYFNANKDESCLIEVDNHSNYF